MLSPGKWHQMIPKEPRANIAWRLRLLNETAKRPELAAGWRKMCREDILFYINGFVWQYNPRKKGAASTEREKVMPFITWDFQDRALLKEPGEPWNLEDDRPQDAGVLWCIAHDEDLIIEKSREMGASWLCLIVMEWLWHFFPLNKFLCISKSEAAVENDDPDSLFWKIDFLHRHLPTWLQVHCKRLHKAGGFLGNQDNDASITGQASTGRAGVGGRATAMFIDEFSQIKEDFEVLSRTSDTTGCRIFNGTHMGMSTAFYQLSKRVDMKKLVMHWTQHPEKKGGQYRFNGKTNKIEVIDRQFVYPPGFQFIYSEKPAAGYRPGIRSPWYDLQCTRKESEAEVGKDLDIDAGGSVSQFFDAIQLNYLIAEQCRPPYWEGDILFDDVTGKPRSLQKAKGGPLKLWINPKGEMEFPIDSYGGGADISQGVGRTNSCISIGQGSTGEKVAEYATAKVLPERLAPLACALCWLFLDEHGQPALFCWEHAGPGVIFGNRVQELGFPRVWHRESHEVSRMGKKTQLVGWSPVGPEKRLLLDNYRDGLYSRQCLNRSKIALQECFFFINTLQGTIEHTGEIKTKDPTGARVNHGDHTIADALM